MTDINLKILILGDCAVGKTSLLLRYTDDNFTESHVSTIGVEYKVKTIEMNGRSVKLQIWDTSGQERFHSITKNFFRSADGVLFIYDITSKETFTNIKEWLKNAQEVENSFEKILIGNKCDLTEKRQVKTEDLEKLGQKMGMTTYETSAKDNINVSLVFQKLAELILDGKSEKEILEKYGEKNDVATIHSKTSKANNPKKDKNCC